MNFKEKLPLLVKDILSALLAGMLIGFAGMAFIMCKANLKDFGSLIGALIFPFGLFLICTLGVNLFTGKIGYALDNDELTLGRLLIMLIFNLVGAALVGISCNLIFKSDELAMYFIEKVASGKANVLNIKSFLTFFLKSIFCGMMVYLAVYLFKTTDNGFLKFIYVLIPIFFFVFMGFEHCIANMFYFTFGFKFTLGTLYSMIASIIGNSIGALILNEMIKLIKK